MKFFLPEAVLEFQNDSPVQDLDKFEAEWEKRGEAYLSYFENIWPSLPSRLTFFLYSKAGWLHDSVWSGIHDGKIVIDLTGGSLIEGPEKVELVYKNCVVTTEKHPGFGSASDGTIWFEYDEYDMTPEGKFIHRILLSNGEEVCITFDDFDFKVIVRT